VNPPYATTFDEQITHNWELARQMSAPDKRLPKHCPTCGREMLWIRTSDSEDIAFASGAITEFDVYSCEQHGGMAVHQDGRIVPHERGVDSRSMVKRRRDAQRSPTPKRKRLPKK
jgi:hypothetical protein